MKRNLFCLLLMSTPLVMPSDSQAMMGRMAQALVGSKNGRKLLTAVVTPSPVIAASVDKGEARERDTFFAEKLCCGTKDLVVSVEDTRRNKGHLDYGSRCVVSKVGIFPYWQTYYGRDGYNEPELPQDSAIRAKRHTRSRVESTSGEGTRTQYRYKYYITGGVLEYWFPGYYERYRPELIVHKEVDGTESTEIILPRHTFTSSQKCIVTRNKNGSKDEVALQCGYIKVVASGPEGMNVQLKGRRSENPEVSETITI